MKRSHSVGARELDIKVCTDVSPLLYLLLLLSTRGGFTAGGAGVYRLARDDLR